MYSSFVPYAGWLVRLCLCLWAQGHAHGFGRASAMALGRYPFPAYPRPSTWLASVSASACMLAMRSATMALTSSAVHSA